MSPPDDRQADLDAIYEGLFGLLRDHNALIGEWQGDFWSSSAITFNAGGSFTVHADSGDIDDGEIWVNLNNYLLDIKRY